MTRELGDELLARITPAAVRLLPSMALSDIGGGPIPIDPQSNPDQPQTLANLSAAAAA